MILLSISKLKGLDTSNPIGCNLYAYCNSNPVMYIDENGNDAIYVSLYSWDDGGLPIVGHALLYYQDKNGLWRCTEYTGKKPRDAIVCDYPVYFDTKDLLKKLTTMDCDYTYLEGDFSSIKEFFDGLIDLNYNGYRLLKRNCLHNVKDALRHSGVNVYISDTIIPKNFKPFIIKLGNGHGMPLISKQHNESGLGGIALLYCFEKTNSFNYLMNNFI